MLHRQQPMNFTTEERVSQVNTYSKGFAVLKDLLGLSATVNTEISLNRYSLFARLVDELLPKKKTLEINRVIESDGNLIWQAGADCRVIITKLQLIVLRLLFNSEGQNLYMGEYQKINVWVQ